jgi:peptidoglycan/xylan/chitin deacetylase (PgdA/CDA1 family)
LQRREFLAASAAGIFLTGTKAYASSPIEIPDPIIRDRVASAIGPYGFEIEKLPKSKIFRLPESGVKRIAWTVDDGASTAGVRDYLDFVERYDLRMTFFITSIYPAWKKNRKQLQELVDKGQVQLANHTRTHSSLTGLSTAGIKKELRDCERFIEDNFGVSAKPYFRPPFGRIDSRVISVAKDVGYKTPIMWSGSLGDSAQQRKQYILKLGNKWIQDKTILLDHFNDRTPRYVFKELAKHLKRRNLMTVTLDDVYFS